MEFIFECSHQYRTSERSERVRYQTSIKDHEPLLPIIGFGIVAYGFVGQPLLKQLYIQLSDTKGKDDDDSDDIQANEQTLNIHQALPPMKKPNFPVFS